MDRQTIGRYELKEQLGRGGMATVYRAYDPHFKRDVAIKLLAQQAGENLLIRQKFEAEARLIAALEHSAIVPVYDYGTHQGQPYLVLRLMLGGTLGDRLGQGSLTVAQTDLVLRRICGALDKAHGNHIIHRDLKPANILFDQEGMPYLADFGIARLTDVTQTTTVIGTPSYMAPEQALGQPLSPRTDVYQMGVVLFEMLTGVVPFKGENSTAVVYQHVHEPIPRLSSIAPHVPSYYQPVLDAAMAKRAEQRPATAGALYTLFQQAASANPHYEATWLDPHPAPMPTEIVAPPPKKQSVWLWAGLGGCLLLLLLVLVGGVGAGGWWLSQNSVGVVETNTAVAPMIVEVPVEVPVTSPPEVAIVTATFTPTSETPNNSLSADEPPTIPPSLTPVPPTITPIPPTPTTMARTASNQLGGGGGMMAFALSVSGQYDIFVAPLDDMRRLIQLTNHPANDFGPRWSPDGGKIVFHSYRDNNWEVYVMNADGTGQVNVTNHGRDDSFGSWSPDGQHLLFHSNRDGDFEIYRINVDGSGLQQLTFNDNQDDLNPTYSPDGSRILFHRRMGSHYQLFVMNGDGTVAQQLTNEPWHHEVGQWSPDGRQILFHGDEEGYTAVYLIPATGGTPRRLSPAGYESFYPMWSLDGEWVAYHGRVPDTENRDIFIINPQTNEERNLTNTSDREERMPAWQP
jgi:serine/threonine protein kinase